MTRVLVARRHLPAMASGALKLVFLDRGVAEAARQELADTLIPLVLGAHQDELLFATLEDVSPDDLIELRSPPTSCLAIVGDEGHASLRLADWWQLTAGMAPPPLLVPTDAAGTERLWRSLSRLLAGVVGIRSRDAADARTALARLREEYEAVREAMGQLEQHLSGRRMGELILVSDYPPSSAVFEVDVGLRHQLISQPLDVPADLLTAVAIHVSRIQVDMRGSMRVRVRALEAERVLGSWLVPFEAMKPGWLRLDFPTPVQSLRESADLEIMFETHTVAPSLSLCASIWPDPDTVGAGAFLAHKVWVAEPGTWYVHPSFWDWGDANRTARRDGIRYELPQELWDRVRQLDLGGTAVADPLTRRFLTCPAGKGIAALHWPAVTLPYGDLLTVTARLLDVKAPPTEIAVVVVEAGRPIQFTRGLDVMPTFASSTGWKSFDPIEDGVMTVILPHSIHRRYDIYFLSQLSGDARESGGWVEWLSCKVFEVAAPAAPEHEAGDGAASGIAPERTLPEVNLFRDVEIVEYFVLDASYRHLTIRLYDSSFGGRHWRRFDFKLSDESGTPGLEFREIGGEQPFVEWPPTTRDAYGPVLKFMAWGDQVLDPKDPAFDRLAPIDRRFLRGLVRSLPSILVTLTRRQMRSGDLESASAAQIDYSTWQGLAHRMTEYFGEASRQA